MTNKLIRHYGRGHLHFITFTCYRRLSLLRSVRASNVFVKILGKVRDRYGFSLPGAPAFEAGLNFRVVHLSQFDR